MISDVLLDTHAFIWLMEGDDTLSIKARQIIKDASQKHFIFVGAISIWEIAMLQSKGRLSFRIPLHKWVEKATSLPFLKVIDLNAEIALQSCKLPGEFHGDPADRMIVATSRILDIPLLTRDKKILKYSEKSFVEAIEC